MAICAVHGKTSQQFDGFSSSRGIEAHDLNRCINFLEFDGREHVVHDSGVLVAHEVEPVLDGGIPLGADDDEVVTVPKPDKRRKSESTRTGVIGSNRREMRDHIGSKLGHGFYDSCSG